MKYIEALMDMTLRLDETQIFMAGGITNCQDWQQEMRKLLEDTELTLVNPRRENFPMDDPNASQEQIAWEYSALRLCDAILFWFPKETLCPIVLYELGAWSMQEKPIFVGCHPEYARIQDVIIQTGLARPTVRVVESLEDLAHQVRIGTRHFIRTISSTTHCGA